MLTTSSVRIAYITDLHLSSGSQRINSLTNKITQLKNKNVSAFFLGGDLLPIASHHWPILEKGLENDIKGTEQKNEMREYIKNLGDEILPEIINAADHTPIFFYHGNADYLGYEYMKNVFPVINFPTPDTSISFGVFNVLGIGGIPIEKDSMIRPYAENSPWFRGNIKAEEYDNILKSMGQLINSNTILTTHIPAFGHVDIFNGQNQGYRPLLDLIKEKSPLLHLTGHVHDAPMTNNVYSFDNAFSIINKTLSVNPGGGNRHDDGEGIRGALIDLTKLQEIRQNGTLTKDSVKKDVIEEI